MLKPHSITSCLTSALVLAYAMVAESPQCPPGCTCDYYSGVHTMDCNSRRMDRFPRDIPAWTTSINMDGNELRRLSSAQLPTKTYLEELRARYNVIERVLIADDRDVITDGNDVMCANVTQVFPRLTRVNLAGNRIRALPKCLLRAWPVLNSLLLPDNRIPSFNALNFFEHVAYQERLEELSLSGNQITRMSRAELYTPANALRGLVLLDLARNRIRWIESGALLFLRDLADLRLSENLLGFIPNHAFVTSGQKLQRISLASNRITVIASLAFAGLPELRELDIKHNLMQCITPFTYATCPPYHPMQPQPSVDLHIVYERRFGVDFSSLTSIHVAGNPWNCDCSLRAALLGYSYRQSITSERLLASVFSAICAGPGQFLNVTIESYLWQSDATECDL